MEESGCALEHPKAARFRSHVISGEWEEVGRQYGTVVHNIAKRHHVSSWVSRQISTVCGENESLVWHVPTSLSACKHKYVYFHRPGH